MTSADTARAIEAWEREQGERELGVIQRAASQARAALDASRREWAAFDASRFVQGVTRPAAALGVVLLERLTAALTAASKQRDPRPVAQLASELQPDPPRPLRKRVQGRFRAR